MKRRFITYTLILMLAALIIMAVTGLLFFFDIKNPFAKELHQVTGAIFVLLIIAHTITFRKVAHNFLFGTPTKKQL